MIPLMGLGAAPTPMAMGFYLFAWGVFSTAMFVGTLKRHPLSEVFVFFTVSILFFLLAAKDWSGHPKVGVAAGVEGIICGLSAIYSAFGEILNETYGRTIIPLGTRSTPKKAIDIQNSPITI